MIKKLIESFFGRKAKPTPTEPFNDNEVKTETLAGGFVYKYPHTSNGTTCKSNNIFRAVRFLFSKKSEKSREEREALYRQVVDREVAQTLEAIQKKVDRQVKEASLSKKN